MEKIMFNGDIKARTEVKVDIEDRGYQFGDGIYEVIRVYNGVLFEADMHITRFIDSAKWIELTMPFTASEIENGLIQLIKENSLIYGIVYLQLTRGVSPRNHAFPSIVVNPVYIAYTKEVPYGGEVKPGIKTITTEDIRWLRCHIKSLNLLGNILAKQKAVTMGCDEALLHRGPIVTEGSSSNISIMTGGVLKTHPADRLILNGITRQVLLKLCKANGIPYVEETFTIEELRKADEVILTNTGLEVTPIIEIDGKPIANGKTGPFTRMLQRLFHEEMERQCGPIDKEPFIS